MGANHDCVVWECAEADLALKHEALGELLVELAPELVAALVGNMQSAGMPTNGRSVTMEAWWPTMRGKLGGSKGHREWCRICYRKHIEPHFASWPLDQIRTPSVLDWIDNQFTNGLKYPTVLKNLKFLKRVLKVANTYEYLTSFESIQHIEIDPKYKPKKQDQEGNPLPAEYIQALWDSKEPGQLKWAALWSAYTGQRKGAMKLARFEHARGLDTDWPEFLFTNQKNGRDQWRPMLPEAVEVLQRYVDECFAGGMPSTGLIFPNTKGRPWGTSYDWQWRDKVNNDGEVIRPGTLKRLGVWKSGDRYTFHNLRDTYISELHNRGLSIDDVQFLARHSSTKVTKTYINTDGARVAERLRRLTPSPVSGDKGVTAPASAKALPV